MTPGCPCTTAGAVTCIGTADGVQCCGGTWLAFSGDPCWGRDAGTPSCDGGPALGCPCSADGTVHCTGVSYRWRLICGFGVWQEDRGHVCC